MNLTRTAIFLAIVWALMLFVIAACGHDEEDTATPAPSSPTATATAVPTAAARAAPTPTPRPPATPSPAAAVRPAPTAAPTAAPTPNPFLDVPGIVDPANFGWPREVEGLNGRVTIPDKPRRIITASVGHDEMTLALVPVGRLVAVGSSSKSELYSNVAHLVQDTPVISRDPEVILAQDPDVVVTSPFFKTGTVDALIRVGVPVVQTEMAQSPEARVNNILLMGYIYGEEERALAFAEEVQARLRSVQEIALAKSQSERLRVISMTSYSDKIWTAGADSTEGGIIEAAGGINVAEEAGLDGNPTISLESVIAMDPDLIIIPQPADGAEEFKRQLLADPALAEVAAIKNGRVVPVVSKHYTTLSYLNLLGVEDMAKTLWPDDFADREFGAFSAPE